MTLSEFKAWFTGYTENMDGPPSSKQWKRIKKIVKDIDGVAISYPVYIERYGPSRYWCWGTNTGDFVPAASNTITVNGTLSQTAMYAAGKTEAEGLLEYSS